LRWPLRLLVLPPFCTQVRGLDDKLGAQVASSIIEDTPLRDHLAAGCYRKDDPEDPLGRVLHAYRLARETRDIRDRLHAAIRQRNEDELDAIALLMGHQRAELVDWAVTEKIIKEDEREPLLAALTALYDVIRVDTFDPDGIRELADCARGKRRVVERPAPGTNPPAAKPKAKAKAKAKTKTQPKVKAGTQEATKPKAQEDVTSSAG
jgi:acyl-CoA dehydrogenase